MSEYLSSTSIYKNVHVSQRVIYPILMLSVGIMCFSIFFCGLCSAATVYVDTDGSGNFNCDGINDHIEINNALTYIAKMGGGTVYLRGPNTYWIDSTLNIGAGTTLTGDKTAEIKLVPDAGWSENVPLIANTATDDDITITGFTIDGNSQSQSGIGLGDSYYILMYFDGAENIEVSNMRLEWGCSDGLKIRNSNGITFSNNDVYKMGHEAFYAISCRNMNIFSNTVFTRTNGACRLSTGAQNAKIYDNTFYSAIAGDSTGPAIELDKTSSAGTSVFDNIEIYNNRVHTMNGAAIWMSASYPDNVIHAKNVHIHHNIFTNVGQYKTNTGYSNAAIVLCSFDNTIIENNVFDDGGHAGIKWFSRPGRPVQNVIYTTIVRNNIIMNCDKVSTVPGSGAGIWNTDPVHSRFIVQNNAFYNNENGQTYGGGFTMESNLNVDPLCVDPFNSNVNFRDYHLKSKAGRYSNGKWITDAVSSPLIDAGYTGSAYSKETSPDGGRINIGRYGNTAEASKSGSAVQNQKDDPPVADAGSDKTITASSAVNFDASASTDDKGIVSYSWDFDASNGITSEATGRTAMKTYKSPGIYTVTLIVTDTSGQRSSDVLNVVVKATAATTGTVTLTPVYDNILRESSPSSVLSSSNYLDIGKSTSNCRDLILFDLSALGKTDTISGAMLSLYWYYPAGASRTSDTIVEVYRPVAWDPDHVSWNSISSGTAWSTAGGNWYDKNGVAQGSTPYTSLVFPANTVPGNKYYEFDVTELVKEYASGKYENTGFFLKAKNEGGNYIAFYSADWSDAAQRPRLTVTSSAVPNQMDNRPVANGGPDKTATIGSVVSFDASGSTDDKGIVSYSWDFDASNGITSEATGRTVTKTYRNAGTYTVTLIATDTSGQRSSDTIQVVVSGQASGDNPPVANAGADRTVTVGSAVSFSGSLSTDDKGIVSYIWDFDASNGITNEATGIKTTKTYAKAGTYTVTLIVVDAKGQKDLDTLTVSVK
ncbi:MAG: DNRLRE domain-containing protein [Methanomethylovorans sp.]|nr:DNRLRE domain-containing protein [Methanomethylovorans sp.]